MNFPKGFLKSLIDHSGFDEAAFVSIHESSNFKVSVRENPFKKAYHLFEEKEQVPWCETGFYLKERPTFTLDPLFHAGAYYVQEASSMFLEEVYKQLKNTKNNPWTVLDLCAAPGGKSTLLNSLLTAEDLLLSNEIIKTRVPVLCDNLTKWGQTNVCVSQNDPKDFQYLENFFDVIVVDAPCSGSGMFRKDPKAMNEWSLENVNHCAARQERILHDIYPSLKKEGYLIYATCSYSAMENEDILDKIANTYDVESIRIPLDSNWGIVETKAATSKAYGYRFYPNKLMGEGFFIACFKKLDAHNSINPKKVKLAIKKQLASPNDINLFTNYLDHPKDFEYLQTPDGICAILKPHLPTVLQLQKNLYLKKSGVKLGKVAGKNIIPDHELALCTSISPSVKKVELDLKSALIYLRKEELSRPDIEMGWLLVTYQNLALGWIKNLGNRINNYYPKALRILMREDQENPPPFI